jgi:arginine decarboxylase
LVAFDNALVDAGVANYNLLKVSSILPIGCVRVEKVDKKPGSGLLTAYSSISSNEKGQIISSAVAVGLPENNSDVGVIMEFSDFCSAKETEEIVRKMVVEAMQKHNIPCKEVASSSAEIISVDGEYVTAVSALAMW